MEPKYSILLCNESINEYRNKIAKWLHQGIKVIWFGNDEDVRLLKAEHSAFAKAFLLLAYQVAIADQRTIIDGNDPDGFVEKVLEKECPLFNSAQFLVEHCRPEKHVIVQASAGTGKTTVMIDRIMFLLHTQPDLHLAEVFMITFTNDAAEQMT